MFPAETKYMSESSQNQGVRIRLAREEDLPAIAELLGELFRIERDFSPDYERQLAGLRLLFGQMPERMLILVAVHADAVVGTCAIHDSISTAEGAQVATLEDLIVSAPFRRAGVGRALLAAAEAHAWCRGARRLQLLADRTNQPALSFYTSHGWEPTQLVVLRRRPARVESSLPFSAGDTGKTGL